MKKLIILSTIFLAFSTTGIHAQTTAPDTAKQQPANTENKTSLKNNRQEIFNQLDLTEDQKKQLMPLQKEERAKREKINNDTLLSAEEKQTQLKALRKESNSKMSKILTPEQIKKLKELKAKK